MPFLKASFLSVLLPLYLLKATSCNYFTGLFKIGRQVFLIKIFAKDYVRLKEISMIKTRSGLIFRDTLFESVRIEEELFCGQVIFLQIILFNE